MFLFLLRTLAVLRLLPSRIQAFYAFGKSKPWSQKIQVRHYRIYDYKTESLVSSMGCFFMWIVGLVSLTFPGDGARKVGAAYFPMNSNFLFLFGATCQSLAEDWITRKAGLHI